MTSRGLIAGLALASLGVARIAAADLPEIEASGRLRVLSARPGAQYIASATGTDGAQVSGVEGELLEGFARLHGLVLEIVEVSGWDDLVPALIAGRGDVVAGNFSDTGRRRERIDFTTQVIPTRLVVVTRRPRRAILTLAELRRERVGTIRGSSMAEAILAAGVPKENIDDSLPQAANISKTLKNGTFTAAVEEVAVAIQAVRDDRELQIGMFLGPAGSLAWGVRKQDPRLRASLDDYIANSRRTATWSRLVVKYYGETALEILRGARGE